MPERFTVNSLDDITDLKSELGEEFLWNLHYEAAYDLNEQPEDLNKKFPEAFIEILEISTDTESLKHNLKNPWNLDLVTDLEMEQEFQEYAENKAKAAFQEFSQHYDLELIENIVQVSKIDWNDLRSRLERAGEFQGPAEERRQQIQSWSAEISPEQVSKNLMNIYRGKVYEEILGSEKSYGRWGSTEGLKTALENIINYNKPEEYLQLLDKIEENVEDQDKYLEVLSSEIQNEKENSNEIGQEVLEEISSIVEEAESHYQLVAETEDAIKTIENTSILESKLMIDYVQDTYSKAFEKISQSFEGVEEL